MGLDWAGLSEALLQVHVGWLAAAIGLMLLDYALQGWRWGVLLRHVDRDVPMRTLVNAIVVMWAFNTLLPLRAGNVIRPALVARERKKPFTTLFFTMVGEYVCDLFALLVMVALTLATLPPHVTENPILADAKRYVPWLAVAGVLSLGFVVALGTRQARQLMERLLSPLPSRRLRSSIMNTFDQLVAGMSAIGRPRRLAQAMGITVLVWVVYLLAILATFEAFSLDIGPPAGLFMMAALTVSMLIPQAPGFLGVFQVVTEQALGLWGAPVAYGQGVALVFWGVCFVPVTVWGLVVASRAGLAFSAPNRDALIRGEDGPVEE